MATESKHGKVRLSLDVASDFHRRLEAAAVEHGLSISEYVVRTLDRALAVESGEADDPSTWARLSARSFARDWDSPEDAVYDQLSEG